MLEVFLNVLAVIAIIVVGGFVVVFLGNLLLSVLDSESRAKNENKENANYQPEQITYSQEPQKLIEDTQVEEQENNQYEDVDFDKANQEEMELHKSELDEAYEKLRAEKEACGCIGKNAGRRTEMFTELCNLYDRRFYSAGVAGCFSGRNYR